MNLDVTKWGQFRIGDLFPILQNGKANQGILSDGNDCFYVGAKKDDNGVMLHCAYDEELIQKGNCIIFICNGQGSVGYANYMDVDFIGTTDIVAGYNEYLNCYNGLFIATVLCQERPKYSFGRKWKTHLRDTIIKLPQTREKLPDWNWMENYIKLLHHLPLRTNNKSPREQINTGKWKEFSLNKLFNISIAKSADIGNLEEGKTPFVGRTNTNNGIQGFVEPVCITEGYCITISMVGTNVALYQENEFQASQNIAVLRNNELNKHRAMFICSMINFEMKLKYSYGRTVGKSNIEEMVLPLPVKYNYDDDPIIDNTCKYSKNGYIPDWDWMEMYIKSLPYGDRL